MALPPLTPESRAKAAEALREAQRRRSEVYELLSHGKDYTVEDAISAAAHTPAIGRITVRKMLSCLPGLGAVGAAKVMAELGIPEDKRLAGLGSEQAQSLREKFLER